MLAHLGFEALATTSGGFAFSMGKRDYTVGREMVITHISGLAAAIRALRAAPPLLSELGSPVPLDDLVDLPHGLVLICGATGSGKSTTLAALAQEVLRRRASMVITLEDPIEHVLATRGARGISRQRQVGRDVKDLRSKD